MLESELPYYPRWKAVPLERELECLCGTVSADRKIFDEESRKS